MDRPGAGVCGLANEEYCRKLCETNVSLRFGFDGLDPEIYQKLRRNRPAGLKKLKALENLKKYSRRKHSLISCFAKGINEKDMPAYLQFCHDNRNLIGEVGLIPLTENWEEGEFDVSVLYAPASDDDPALRAAIEAEGCTTAYFNARFETPTLDDLLPYAAVITHINYSYHDQVAFGDVLADYVDAGGTVILGQWTLPTFDPAYALSGRIMNEPGYNPATGTSFDWDGGTYSGDGVTEIHTGVGAYAGTFWDIVSPVTFNGTSALTDGTCFSSGHPSVVYWDGYVAPAGGGGIVFYSAGNAGLASGSGDWGHLIANMAGITVVTGSDCNRNCIPDECEPDCDGDGIPNDCEQCGDLDQDEDVDADDYHLFGEAYGGPVDGVPAHDACADYDNDGMVTALDYQQWLLCYRAYIEGSTAGQPADDREDQAQPKAARTSVQQDRVHPVSVRPARPG